MKANIVLSQQALQMLEDTGGDDCLSWPGVSLLIATALIKGGSSGCMALYLASFIFSLISWHFVSAHLESKGKFAFVCPEKAPSNHPTPLNPISQDMIEDSFNKSLTNYSVGI